MKTVFFDPASTSFPKSTVRREFGPLIAAQFVEGPYPRPGKQTVQIRQHVKNIYGGSVHDSLFEDRTADIRESDRVVLLNVPDDVTLEDVQRQLNGAVHAKIYQVLAHDVIETPQLKAAFEMGRSSVEQQEEKQRVRTKEGEDIPDQRTGQLMYRLYIFSMNAHEDVDLREYAAAPAAMRANANALMNPDQEM